MPGKTMMQTGKPESFKVSRVLFENIKGAAPPPEKEALYRNAL